MYHQPPHPKLVKQFLALDRFQAIALVLQYKAQMIQQGLKEATVNRRLSALKSLVQFANKLGHCQWSLQEIQGEPVQAYRDTTGIAPAGIKAMLAVPDRQTRSGKRDYAILRLLWDNALRRQEVVGANVADFDPQRRTLAIRGKGKGSQQTLISLSLPTNEAIAQWLAELQAIALSAPANPLFIALDPAHLGHRLTGTAIYQLVQTAAQRAGIAKIMSPHRIRHSAITAALDATNGNVRKVQKLSRHKKLDTLMIYDDNRANLQGEVSSLLSELI
jgi:integrase/recombinase XerC